VATSRPEWSRHHEYGDRREEQEQQYAGDADPAGDGAEPRLGEQVVAAARCRRLGPATGVGLTRGPPASMSRAALRIAGTVKKLSTPSVTTYSVIEMTTQGLAKL
jgi:hypothetical protein